MLRKLLHCIFIWHIVTDGVCEVTLLLEKFNAIYGQSVISNKVNVTVASTTTKTRCAAFCQDIVGCGGFNVRKLDNGLLQCELKQGFSTTNQVGDIQDEATYYEKTVQNPSIVSRNCADLQKAGITVSSVYEVNLDPDGKAADLRRVYCDMDTDGGGWTTLMKREDGSVDFNRNWADYRNGFGNLSGEHWLGLETMYQLLNKGILYKLRVDMKLFTGETGYCQYDYFDLEPEANAYTLHVSGSSGTANDSLSYQNNMPFSTIDVDNDVASYSCAEACKGGFWYKSCSAARLTGLYGETLPRLIIEGNIKFVQGILWWPWLDDDTHPQYADMKIRP